MGLWAKIFRKDTKSWERQLAEDLSVVWSGLVATAPSGVTIGEIVEQYGYRVPQVLAHGYKDVLGDMWEFGPEDKIRHIALEGIILAGHLSASQLAEVRKAMGL